MTRPMTYFYLKLSCIHSSIQGVSSSSPVTNKPQTVFDIL